jgi:two-component system phosphate regulon response regulator PhoB
MTARILIVEDEEPLTLILRYNLESEGYAVDASARGDEAELRLKETPPDLAVIDWMLPGLSGIELIRRLRAKPETRRLPIIMLTARGEEAERVRGLATGADDYIVKPFSVPELLAHPGRVFSREQLLDQVWGRDVYIDERTVDVHVGRLRKALNRGRMPDPIRTVRGAGYALNDRFGKTA